MAEPSVDGDYVRLFEATMWWKSKDNEIHLTIKDDDLHHAGSEPGMRIVFSPKPQSANYHPGNFNRCAAVLRKYGKSAPDDVDEGSRRLDKR